MGGASSRVTRQLPRTTKPTWSGARAAPGQAQAKPTPRASEIKNAVIEEDSKDPHLAANLVRLGPVHVNHLASTAKQSQTVDYFNRTFQNRLQSEQQAHSQGSTHNRIVASVLADLLDKRKTLSQYRDLQNLAEKYNVDVGKVESVARYVTSPSIDQGSIVRIVNEDGSERTTMKAIWVDSPIVSP